MCTLYQYILRQVTITSMLSVQVEHRDGLITISIQTLLTLHRPPMSKSHRNLKKSNGWPRNANTERNSRLVPDVRREIARSHSNRRMLGHSLFIEAQIEC